MLLNNEQGLARPTLDLNSDELHYYPFIISLNRCNGSCNTLDDLWSRICAADKAEDTSLNVVNMITRINKSKTLTNHISCNSCKFDNRFCNSN